MLSFFSNIVCIIVILDNNNERNNSNTYHLLFGMFLHTNRPIGGGQLNPIMHMDEWWEGNTTMIEYYYVDIYPIIITKVQIHFDYLHLYQIPT